MNISAEDRKLFEQLRVHRIGASHYFKSRSFRNLFNSVSDKYSESAHFIYELLQNADDVGATYVDITLAKDCLVFKHNGSVKFSVTPEYEDESKKLGHINSITGIASSTKDLDTQKIGKFGVGFKAVFQYTDEPHVYDDKFWFKISSFIIPEELESDFKGRDKGETLFYLPFNNKKKAFSDIEQRLNKLNNPILFLNNLKVIRWKYENDSKIYEFRKDEIFVSSYENVTMSNISICNGGKQDNIIMFTSFVNLKEHGKHYIKLGYYLNENGDIDTKVRPNIFCFFPTQEKFNLCFICHAPFLLVDSRQQMKNNEEINKLLVSSLAKLQAKSLIMLRDSSIKTKKVLLNENLFQIIPLKLNSFFDGDNLTESNDFFNECLNAIKSNRLILSNKKNYLNIDEACLCTPTSLMSLIKDEHLQTLTKRSKLQFVLRKISAIDEYYFRRYCREYLFLRTYTSFDLAQDISSNFMESQSIDWVISLYKFIKRNASSLLSSEEEASTIEDVPFRYAPIILTRTNKFVPAYDENGLLNVYLPLDTESKGYNFVSRKLYPKNPKERDSNVTSFFVDLGIKEPNQFDYICNLILPKYSSKEQIDDEDLISDLDLILSYYFSSNEKEKNKLIGVLKDKKYKLLSQDDKIYLPRELFDQTNALLSELASITKHPILNRKFYLSLLDKYGESEVDNFFTKLGLKINPISKKQIYFSWYSYSNLTPAQVACRKKIINQTAYEMFDKEICGLEQLFNKYNINHASLPKELSILLWNCLIDNVTTTPNWNKNERWNYGYIRYRYYSWYDQPYESSLFSLLKSSNWLLNGKKPNEVFQEDLVMNGYTHSDDLFAIFNIESQGKSLKDLGASDTQIENEALGHLLKQNGVNKEDIPFMIELYRKHKNCENINNHIGSNNHQNNFNHHNSANTTTNNIEQKESNEDDVVESFDSRDEVSKVSLEDMFKKTTKSKTEETIEKQEEKINTEEEDINQEIEEEKAKQDRIAELRNIVEISERYSKEWFEALLELEHKGCNIVEKDSPKAININFRKVDKESDRIYILSDSSRGVPTWLEEIGNIEVNFSFSDREDSKIKFEVANVRDFSLRLKASNVYKEKLSLIDWAKCTKASVSIKNQLDLTSKLLTAFRGLNLPDGYNLKDNLSSNINFIFGPPGTGKTTRLADNIIRLMSDKKRHKILVLAPTNTACDELARKIKEKINGLDCSWLARFVATSDEKLEDIVVDRDSLIYEEKQCCVISTMARLSFDGFEGYNLLKDIAWDLVICDEASMIHLAEIAHTIYQFQSSCPILIAGDPMQICPFGHDPEWENENIYSMIKLDRFDNPQTEPIQFRIENLGMQYRSLPPIGELFSQYAYNGKLNHYRSMMNAPKYKFGKLSLKPITFMPFKVERFDSIFGAKKLDGSNVHLYSVLLTVETCKYVSKQYAILNEGKFSIGIICPYAPQARLIENLINQSSDIPDNISITVGTVHRFQGGQCNLIFAVFNPPKGITNNSHVNNKNIVNVAISRAQDYLCILLPHCGTDGYDRLYELNQIGLITQKDPNNVQTYTCDEIEEIIYGKKFYIENNTFVTSHQLANVYTKPIKKYEIRIDESSVDIQLGDK